MRVDIVPGSVKGKVIEIDGRGSLITDIHTAQLTSAPRDASVRITVDEHETFGIFTVPHDQPAMTLIALVDGNESPLKIELVDDSASAMLGVRAGAPVEVVW
jgi:S-adenosylmethionine hydrolase